MLNRIECIDISQISGSDAVGSLVVLDHGIINTSLYRKFSIHQIEAQNDTKMIQQVITRRFHHPEWEFPNLLIVDGGKGQVKAAYEALFSCAISIPIIGLAKRFEHIIVQNSGVFKEIHIPITRPGVHIVQRIRDESHRFAHQYHVVKRKKAYLPKI
jgi:excinuclease ABC subunit C